MPYTSPITSVAPAGLGRRTHSDSPALRGTELASYETSEHDFQRGVQALPLTRTRSSMRRPARKPYGGIGLGLPSAMRGAPQRRVAASYPSPLLVDAADYLSLPDSEVALHGLGLALPVDDFIAIHVRCESSDTEIEADALAMYSCLPPGLSSPMPCSPNPSQTSPAVLASSSMSRGGTTMGGALPSRNTTVMPGAPRIVQVGKFKADPLYA